MLLCVKSLILYIVEFHLKDVLAKAKKKKGKEEAVATETGK